MPWIYLKIILSFSIPLATVTYARQFRIKSDMNAIQWDVQHPPSLQWSIDHQRESRRANQIEARYLRQLVNDLGK